MNAHAAGILIQGLVSVLSQSNAIIAQYHLDQQTMNSIPLRYSTNSSTNADIMEDLVEFKVVIFLVDGGQGIYIPIYTYLC